MLNKIVFGDTVGRQMVYLGVKPWIARLTVKKPDAESAIGFDDLTVYARYKRHPFGRVLALCTVRPLRTDVLAVMPVPESIPDGNPIDTLNAMTERFGFPVTVGNVTSTLIYQTEIPRIGKLVSVTGDIPPHHKDATVLLVKDMGAVARVVLAFSLDTTEIKATMTH